MTDPAPEPIELDYDLIDGYKSNEYSDEWCLESILRRYPNTNSDELSDETKAGLIKLARLDIYDHDQHRYIAEQYGAKLDPSDAVMSYLGLIVDTILPMTDPRRIALEIEFKERMVRGTLHAKRTIEERAGKPQLIKPGGGGLVVPGR